MAAPRRGPRWPTNRGKCGFDNLSATWPKLNVVSSSPWSSQSYLEPHVSCEQHRYQRPVGPQIFRAIGFEVDTASAGVVGEPEYSPGDVGAVRGEDVAMLAQIRGSEVLSELLLASLRREAV